MPIGGRIVNKLGSGIGLASEAYKHHSDKKAHDTSGSTAGVSPEHTVPGETTDDSDVDDDESSWALDEASQELSEPPPSYGDGNHLQTTNQNQSASSDKDAVAAFLSRHAQFQHPQNTSELPVPVIIPQRRPRDTQRGFVLAYPPLLNDHGRIDETTFLDFLGVLNKSCESSSAFEVINMAAFATGLVPTPTTHIISVSMHKAAAVGSEAQTRVQRNTLLDQFNERFFQPRGLWAMVVTWRPEASGSRLLDLNLRSSLLSSGSHTMPQPGQTHNAANVLASASGTTTGHIPIDACAPLVYPALDDAVAKATPIPESKQSSLKASQAFVADYLDRRGAAEFAGRHPDSAVAAPATGGFASRYADPNHAANSGTLLGLVSGGTFDPRAKVLGHRAQRRAQRRGQILSAEEIRDVETGRRDAKGRIVEEQGVRGRMDAASGYRMSARKKGVRRMVKPDVCYLMIVAWPENMSRQ